MEGLLKDKDTFYVFKDAGWYEQYIDDGGAIIDGFRKIVVNGNCNEKWKICFKRVKYSIEETQDYYYSPEFFTCYEI